METIVQWNAGMSSACVCWAARKMIRLPCLCVHRNMNVITPPYPISRVVVCTCDRGIAGVYMWPSFCVRRWPHLCVHVTVGSLVCTCDRRFACAGDRKARKRLCVYMWPGFACAGWPLDPLLPDGESNGTILTRFSSQPPTWKTLLNDWSNRQKPVTGQLNWARWQPRPSYDDIERGLRPGNLGVQGSTLAAHGRRALDLQAMLQAFATFFGKGGTLNLGHLYSSCP